MTEPQHDINSSKWDGYPHGFFRGCLFALPFGVAAWALIIWAVRYIATGIGEAMQ